MKAATSAPGSRRTSRDASVNGRSSFQSAQPDESSGRPKDDITTQRDQPESSLPATSSQSDPAASLETPSSHEAEPSRIQPPEDLQSPNSVTSDTTTLTPSSSTMKRFSITSLTSTRPAPPSPVPSRRPSLQRKASSSRRSTHSTASRDAYPSTTPSDKVSGFPGDRSSRRQSTLSMSFTWLAAEGGTTEEKEEDLLSPRPDKQITKSVEGTSKPESVLSVNHDDGYISKPIIVRDFAYSEDDERFAKRPIELLPHSERPLTSGESHDQADGDGEWDEDDEDGGGWHTQWQLTPVQNGSNLEEVGDGTGGGWLDPDLPLPPGIYRAVYAFEAEGTAEMSLEEGQLVKVIGRGGGVGWAVVERDWTPERMTNRDDLDSSASGDGIDASGSGALALAGQALVPEGYLESYQVDDPGDVN
ncbi:hypothetical protein FRC17_003732 [Serendipita sp. 399]|nr:hypothetical protein FRC17_003732 [Serendipita sp. 399]